MTSSSQSIFFASQVTYQITVSLALISDISWIFSLCHSKSDAPSNIIENFIVMQLLLLKREGNWGK